MMASVKFVACNLHKVTRRAFMLRSV